MSFILDALKKSESDRQRQSGPALFEVKVAPPRTRLPPWALAIAALLVVNLGIVMWLLMRHAPHPAAGADTLTGAAPAATPGASAGGAASIPAGTRETPAPTALASASGPPPSPSVTAPAATGNSTARPEPAAPTAAPLPMPGGAGHATGTAGGAAGSSVEGANADDYAPAEEEPASAVSGAFNGRVRRGTSSGLPLYQDAAATPGTQIPQLRLDLHVFALRPQDRFAMINMHKVHEGDTLPEGVHVDSITPDGAVLSYNGSRFLLPRE